MRSSGFTLIELLVVVAIIGILSAIGTLTYSGYVGAAKKNSAQNIMQQISLAQTEEYSMTGEYFLSEAGGTCVATSNSSNNIETALFQGTDVIPSEIDFNFCIAGTTSNYTILAENGSGCVLTLPRNGSVDKSGCP